MTRQDSCFAFRQESFKPFMVKSFGLQYFVFLPNLHNKGKFKSWSFRKSLATPINIDLRDSDF
ncbi:MAG TPA: hypothetical protein DEO56_09840 [Nitrosomonas nitrosa]|nr:hypothetical protein [Nitrosomonas nitrosa]